MSIIECQKDPSRVLEIKGSIWSNGSMDQMGHMGQNGQMGQISQKKGQYGHEGHMGQKKGSLWPNGSYQGVKLDIRVISRGQSIMRVQRRVNMVTGVNIVIRATGVIKGSQGVPRVPARVTRVSGRVHMTMRVQRKGQIGHKGHMGQYGQKGSIWLNWS